jgi:hypothetical protein
MVASLGALHECDRGEPLLGTDHLRHSNMMCALTVGEKPVPTPYGGFLPHSHTFKSQGRLWREAGQMSI